MTVVKLFLFVFFFSSQLLKGVKQVYCSNEKHIFTVINIYKYIYKDEKSIYVQVFKAICASMWILGNT